MRALCLLARVEAAHNPGSHRVKDALSYAQSILNRAYKGEYDASISRYYLPLAAVAYAVEVQESLKVR